MTLLEEEPRQPSLFGTASCSALRNDRITIRTATIIALFVAAACLGSGLGLQEAALRNKRTEERYRIQHSQLCVAGTAHCQQ